MFLFTAIVLASPPSWPRSAVGTIDPSPIAYEYEPQTCTLVLTNCPPSFAPDVFVYWQLQYQIGNQWVTKSQGHVLIDAPATEYTVWHPYLPAVGQEGEFLARYETYVAFTDAGGTFRTSAKSYGYFVIVSEH